MQRQNQTSENVQDHYDDSKNSYKYVVFVLVVYAVSFMALMVKYFRKSTHDRPRDADFLYNEFVKRDTFREKDAKARLGQKKMMVDALAEQLPLASIGITVEVPSDQQVTE